MRKVPLQDSATLELQKRSGTESPLIPTVTQGGSGCKRAPSLLLSTVHFVGVETLAGEVARLDQLTDWQSYGLKPDSKSKSRIAWHILI